MNSDSLDAANLLCWWHQYQAQRLNRTADFIRNGLMQELFALRRELELSCRLQSNADAFGCDHHLTKLEYVYTQLENVTNYLDSPFLKESLPLALQHTIQPWHQSLPLILDLPLVWESEPIERTRLLMTLTEHLLTQLTAATVRPHQCGITLKQQADLKQLTYRIAYAEKLPNLGELFASLTPFLKTFQLFAQREYEHTVLNRETTWVLRWQM